MYLVFQYLKQCFVILLLPIAAFFTTKIFLFDGDRLVVELANDIFEGDYGGGSSDRIDLINVVEYPTNIEVAKQISFYRLVIVSVSILNKHETAQNEDEAVANSDEVIQVCRDEFDRLKEMTLDYIYMPTMDHRYVEATNHLFRCESIGVVGLGGEFGRMRTISLLVLSSWDQIYIFDLYLYRERTFPSELRQILESDSIKKIVHDSRALVDCLDHCHKVQINNLFDTQTADIMISKSRNGTVPDDSRSISDCLKYYLNIPNSLLLATSDVKSTKWNLRPLTDTCKIKAAQLSTYLWTLKVKVENIMLKYFTEAVELYSMDIQDVNDCMARVSLGKDDVPEEVKKATDKDIFN